MKGLGRGNTFASESINTSGESYEGPRRICILEWGWESLGMTSLNFLYWLEGWHYEARLSRDEVVNGPQNQTRDCLRPLSSSMLFLWSFLGKASAILLFRRMGVGELQRAHSQ